MSKKTLKEFYEEALKDVPDNDFAVVEALFNATMSISEEEFDELESEN